MESLFALWRAYIAAQKGSSKVSEAQKTWSYDIWGLIHLHQMRIFFFCLLEQAIEMHAPYSTRYLKWCGLHRFTYLEVVKHY